MDMTKEALREYCKKNKLYLTEELNDKMYLHYKARLSVLCGFPPATNAALKTRWAAATDWWR